MPWPISAARALRFSGGIFAAHSGGSLSIGVPPFRRFPVRVLRRLGPLSSVRQRAAVCHRQGRNDDALMDLNQHLALHPEDSGAYLFRSTLRKKQGSWLKSHKDLLEAYQIAPKHPWVCNGLAWFLATCPLQKFRDGRRAVELARVACDITQWKQPNCLDTLAAAYAESGDFDEAVQWQTQAVDLSSPDDRPDRQARLELYLDCKSYHE
jgi:tetratricopeptide (TPR) repeat protein